MGHRPDFFIGDATTNKSEGGTQTMMGGSGYNDAAGPGGKPDKVFQHNSKISTTIVIEGFTLKSQQGKLWPSFGDCLACMCLNFNGDKAGRAQPHFDSMLFTLDHIKQIQPDCPH